MRARFRVSPDEAGQTVAALLRKHVTGLTWSRARALIDRGQVRIGGQAVADHARRARAGDELVVDEAAPSPERQAARARVVFEDPHVVVIDKPAGVSSVPYEKRDAGTAMDLVRDAWRAAGRRATATPLFIVHRIDKDTSGLLAFAKTKTGERALQAQLRAHTAERTYLCVAHGVVSDRRIESRLVTDRGDGLRGSTRKPREGKRAVTHVRARERVGAQATLCEVRLETGKTHQIRIHLAESGHPVVGERVYVRDFVKRGGELLESPRLLLHAATLGFAHPVSGEMIRLEAPLPDDFLAAVGRLRKR